MQVPFSMTLQWNYLLSPISQQPSLSKQQGQPISAPLRNASCLEGKEGLALPILACESSCAMLPVVGKYTPASGRCLRRSGFRDIIRICHPQTRSMRITISVAKLERRETRNQRGDKTSSCPHTWQKVTQGANKSNMPGSKVLTFEAECSHRSS